MLLAATFVPHLGVTVNGNRNWVQLGSSSLRIQPSEFAKLAMVIWSASILAAKGRRLADPRHLVFPLIPVFGLLLALVLGGRDLGTALVLFAITLVTLFIVGVPLRWFVIAVVVVMGVIAYLVSQSPNRMRRVLSFSDPMSDPLGTGWQAAHSFFALASGGWWGVGIGASKEKWGALPAAHTDFILAVIGEELGLAGTLVVLFLFLTLAYGGIRIAMRAKSTFVTFAAVEIVAWLMAQALVNIGAVTGLLPIAGIPLPLISYGGSAMLPTLMAIGLLLNFARAEPGAAEALAGSSLRHRLGLAPEEGREGVSLRVLMAGGGSIGHVSPLLALFEELRSRDPGTAFLCLGTATGLESRVLPGERPVHARDRARADAAAAWSGPGQASRAVASCGRVGARSDPNPAGRRRGRLRRLCVHARLPGGPP